MSDLPLRALCSEFELPEHGPMVVVGLAVSGAAIECPPRHALQAAELLIDHALTLDPELARRGETVRPLASLLERLWAATESYLPQLLRLDECRALRGVIDREVRARVTEDLIGVREAARKRGLADAAAVVRKLVMICGEPDDRVRSIALAGLHQEIAGAAADLDAGIAR